jgi:CelD/BcsL family acetyltransferase involved in cellulose biosynthesis
MIEHLHYDEWCSADRRHPAPTFFARPAWARALCDTLEGVEPFALRVRIGSRRVLVPGLRSRTRGLRFQEIIAFPLGGYTCVMDEQGNAVDEPLAREALERLSKHIDHMRVVLWPLGPQPELRGAKIQHYETAVIDCSGGFEHVVAGIRGVTRRMAGQAERRGVECVRSTSIDDLDDYFEILRDASVAWGLPKPPISLELLRAVFVRGGADAELWFACVDGERIAGGVVLYGSDELFFWSAAMRREFGKLRPSNALNLRLIKAACERGVRWYNLGASEGLEGVARFKHDLGAESRIYVAQSTRRPMYGVYERMRGALLPSGRSA